MVGGRAALIGCGPRGHAGSLGGRRVSTCQRRAQQCASVTASGHLSLTRSVEFTWRGRHAWSLVGEHVVTGRRLGSCCAASEVAAQEARSRPSVRPSVCPSVRPSVRDGESTRSVPTSRSTGDAPCSVHYAADRGSQSAHHVGTAAVPGGGTGTQHGGTDS